MKLLSRFIAFVVCVLISVSSSAFPIYDVFPEPMITIDEIAMSLKKDAPELAPIFEHLKTYFIEFTPEAMVSGVGVKTFKKIVKKDISIGQYVPIDQNDADFLMFAMEKISHASYKNIRHKALERNSAAIQAYIAQQEAYAIASFPYRKLGETLSIPKLYDQPVLVPLLRAAFWLSIVATLGANFGDHFADFSTNHPLWSSVLKAPFNYFVLPTLGFALASIVGGTGVIMGFQIKNRPQYKARAEADLALENARLEMSEIRWVKKQAIKTIRCANAVSD